MIMLWLKHLIGNEDRIFISKKFTSLKQLKLELSEYVYWYNNLFFHRIFLARRFLFLICLKTVIKLPVFFYPL